MKRARKSTTPSSVDHDSLSEDAVASAPESASSSTLVLPPLPPDASAAAPLPGPSPSSNVIPLSLPRRRRRSSNGATSASGEDNDNSMHASSDASSRSQLRASTRIRNNHNISASSPPISAASVFSANSESSAREGKDKHVDSVNSTPKRKKMRKTAADARNGHESMSTTPKKKYASDLRMLLQEDLSSDSSSDEDFEPPADMSSDDDEQLYNDTIVEEDIPSNVLPPSLRASVLSAQNSSKERIHTAIHSLASLASASPSASSPPQLASDASKAETKEDEQHETPGAAAAAAAVPIASSPPISQTAASASSAPAASVLPPPLTPMTPSTALSASFLVSSPISAQAPSIFATQPQKQQPSQPSNGSSSAGSRALASGGPDTAFSSHHLFDNDFMFGDENDDLLAQLSEGLGQIKEDEDDGTIAARTRRRLDLKDVDVDDVGLRVDMDIYQQWMNNDDESGAATPPDIYQSFLKGLGDPSCVLPDEEEEEDSDPDYAPPVNSDLTVMELREEDDERYGNGIPQEEVQALYQDALKNSASSSASSMYPPETAYAYAGRPVSAQQQQHSFSFQTNDPIASAAAALSAELGVETAPGKQKRLTRSQSRMTKRAQNFFYYVPPTGPQTVEQQKQQLQLQLDADSRPIASAQQLQQLQQLQMAAAAANAVSSSSASGGFSAQRITAAILPYLSQQSQAKNPAAAAALASAAAMAVYSSSSPQQKKTISSSPRFPTLPSSAPSPPLMPLLSSSSASSSSSSSALLPPLPLLDPSSSSLEPLPLFRSAPFSTIQLQCLHSQLSVHFQMLIEILIVSYRSVKRDPSYQEPLTLSYQSLYELFKERTSAASASSSSSSASSDASSIFDVGHMDTLKVFLDRLFVTSPAQLELLRSMLQVFDFFPHFDAALLPTDKQLSRKKVDRTKWSPAEDQLLALGIRRYGLDAWQKIHERLLPNFTDKQIQARQKFLKGTNPGSVVALASNEVIARATASSSSSSSIVAAAAAATPAATAIITASASASSSSSISSSSILSPVGMELMQPLSDSELGTLIEALSVCGEDFSMISDLYFPTRSAEALQYAWSEYNKIKKQQEQSSSASSLLAAAFAYQGSVDTSHLKISKSMYNGMGLVLSPVPPAPGLAQPVQDISASIASLSNSLAPSFGGLSPSQAVYNVPVKRKYKTKKIAEQEALEQQKQQQHQQQHQQQFIPLPGMDMDQFQQFQHQQQQQQHQQNAAQSASDYADVNFDDITIRPYSSRIVEPPVVVAPDSSSPSDKKTKPKKPRKPSKKALLAAQAQAQAQASGNASSLSSSFMHNPSYAAAASSSSSSSAFSSASSSFVPFGNASVSGSMDYQSMYNNGLFDPNQQHLQSHALPPSSSHISDHSLLSPSASMFDRPEAAELFAKAAAASASAAASSSNSRSGARHPMLPGSEAERSRPLLEPDGNSLMFSFLRDGNSRDGLDNNNGSNGLLGINENSNSGGGNDLASMMAPNSLFSFMNGANDNSMAFPLASASSHSLLPPPTSSLSSSNNGNRLFSSSAPSNNLSSPMAADKQPRKSNGSTSQDLLSPMTPFGNFFNSSPFPQSNLLASGSASSISAPLSSVLEDNDSQNSLIGLADAAVSGPSDKFGSNSLLPSGNSNMPWSAFGEPSSSGFDFMPHGGSRNSSDVPNSAPPVFSPVPNATSAFSFASEKSAEFSKEEDRQILQAVRAHGNSLATFEQLASSSTKTAKQIQDRFSSLFSMMQ